METEVIASSKVDAHWLSGGEKFWYRIELCEGEFEFILVDAVNCTCQRSLSEETLVQEVERLTGEKPDLASLAVKDAEWNGPLNNDNLKGNFATEEVPSPYAATAVSLRFVNKCSCAITAQWIDHSAEPVLYGTIGVGESKQFTTWQGHIWRLCGQEEGKPSKLLYAAPKEDDNDVLVINDDLLYDREGARTPKRERDFPEVFIRGNSVWVAYEDGNEEKVSGDEGDTEIYDKERIYASPDKKYIVVWQYTPEQEHKVYLVESSPIDQLQPKMHALQYLKPGNQIRIDRPRLFDFVQRKEIVTDDSLFRNPYDLTDAGWDKASQEYRFIYNERGHQHLRVIGMAVDGRVRALVEESSATFIDYSSKLYRHIILDTEEMIWASERDGWNHLYLVDLAHGSLKNQITAGEWLVRSVDRIDEEKRQIWFTSYGMVKGQDPYYAQLARINFDGSGLTLLTEGDGTHSWRWSPDHRFLIDTWARVDCPPETILRNGETGVKLLTLQESRLAHLVDTKWNAPEIFSTTGRDGVTMIYGLIIRPADFDATKRYPILEEIYAGPHSYFTPKNFSGLSWLRRWADKGYIVVRLDGMGTNWRSRAFHDVCYKNLQDAGFPDRIKWMREAAATRPWMDLDRVGIRGGSAGGQSAGAALIHHGDFYKAAAADCGCHDSRMDKIWWQEQWMGWPVDKAYEEGSNVVNAAKLQGDLMLLVGDLDHNVDPSSTLQFVNALNKANKIYELVVIPGGKHGSGGREYGVMRQVDFFRRHLLEK